MLYDYCGNHTPKEEAGSGYFSLCQTSCKNYANNMEMAVGYLLLYVA